MGAMFLGVNLAVEPFSIGIVSEKGPVASYQTMGTYHFTENVMVVCRSLLKDHALEWSSIKGVAVVNGPGSYTGLRLGVSFAKTVAQTQGIPIYGLSSFEAALWSFKELDEIVLMAFSARKHEVNAQVMAVNSGDIRPVSDLFSVSEDTFVSIKDRYPSIRVMVNPIVQGFDVAFYAREQVGLKVETSFQFLQPFYSHDPV